MIVHFPILFQGTKHIQGLGLENIGNTLGNIGNMSKKKSLDVFGYDLFFLENPSSSRKKCHAHDSEKVDRHTITDSIYTL